MKKFTALSLLALFVALVGASTAKAATVTTAGSGNWSSITVNVPWPGGTVPAAGDDVIIASGNTVTVTANVTNSPGTVTINSGGQLTVGGFNLTVTGATTVSGTLLHNNSAGTPTYTGNVTINSGGLWNETAAASISFGGNLQNDGMLTASNGFHTFSGTTKTFSGANAIVIPSVTVDGTYQNNGTLTVNTALGGSGTLTQGMSATLNLRGTATSAAGITNLNATASPNTVNYNGTAAQTVKAVSYNNLVISGSNIKTLGGTVGVAGDLIISGSTLNLAGFTANRASAGGTLTLGSGTTLRIGDGGTLPANYSTHSIDATSTIEYYGNGYAQIVATLNSFQNYGNLLISGGGAKTLAGSIGVAGNLTVSAGTLDLGPFTADRTTIGGTLTLTNVTSVVLKIGGTGTMPANYASHSFGATSTNEYSGTGQTISAEAYGNLTTSGSGTKTLASGTTSIAGNLTIGTGTTFDAGANDFSITGNWTNNGSFTASGSQTVTYTGGSSPTIGGLATTTFNNLTINKTSGTIAKAVADFTVARVFTIQAGTFDGGPGYITTLSGSGTPLVVNGTFNPGSSTIKYTSPTGANVTGTNYYHLTLDSSGQTFTAAGNISVAGNWTNTGGTFVPGTGTVEFNGGNVAQFINGTATSQTFNNLTIKKTSNTLSVSGGTITLTVKDLTETSGNFTAPGTLNINGSFVHTAGVFTAGTNVSIGGNWTNNATGFTDNGGTVTFNGAAQAIAGSTATTFNNLTIANAAVVTVSTSATVGLCTVNSDATLGGTAAVAGPVVLNGTIAPGGSVGRLTTGRETWNGSAACRVEMIGATNGPGIGWDLLSVTNSGINLLATAGSPFTLKLMSLNGTGSAGGVTNFNNNSNYTWTIAITTNGTVTNFAAAKFTNDTTLFANDLAGGVFGVAQSGTGNTNLNVTFTPNHAPVAYATNFSRSKGVSLKINIASLLANSTSDADGDTRSLLSVGVSTNGSTLFTNGTYIFLSPTNDLAESFTYVARDVRSSYRAGDTVRTATNWITVTVTAQGGIAYPPVLTNGTAVLNFAGIPGYAYDVQRATNADFSGTVALLATTNAPSGGVFIFVDGSPPQPQAFYRLMSH